MLRRCANYREMIIDGMIKGIQGDFRFLRALILRLLAVGVKLLAIDSDGVR